MGIDYKHLLQKNNLVIFWSIQFFIWTFYFIFDLLVIHRYTYHGIRSGEFKYLLYPIIYCYAGLIFSLLLKFSIDKLFNRLKMIPLLLFTGIITPFLLSNCWYLLRLGLDQVIIKRGGFANPLVDYLWEVFIGTIILVAWAGVYLFIKFWREWLIQKFQTEQALLREENARLKMLRYQLNPHFLFNTLSSLRAMIREDQEKATVMVGKISDYLRYTLVNKSETSVPLEAELTAAENYIQIEKIRFGDKLKVDMDIEDQCLAFKVPGFIIHPLVENAIKYGMETSPMPLKVKIKAVKILNRLTITISNTGKWIPEGDVKSGTGTGLKNVRDRLAQIYPNNHAFEIEKGAETVQVVMEIYLMDNGNTNQGTSSR